MFATTMEVAVARETVGRTLEMSRRLGFGKLKPWFVERGVSGAFLGMRTAG
jgi:hypothetical protein